MRLDLFLKASRLSSGRSQAQKLCDAGLVSINHRPAKPAHVVKPGDLLTIHTRSRLLEARITTLPATRNTARRDAASLYEVIDDQRLVTEE
jgi:ribosomal 50S subunit-recycling heat shock protein